MNRLLRLSTILLVGLTGMTAARAWGTDERAPAAALPCNSLCQRWMRTGEDRPPVRADHPPAVGPAAAAPQHSATPTRAKPIADLRQPADRMGRSRIQSHPRRKPVSGLAEAAANPGAPAQVAPRQPVPAIDPVSITPPAAALPALVAPLIAPPVRATDAKADDDLPASPATTLDEGAGTAEGLETPARQPTSRTMAEQSAEPASAASESSAFPRATPRLAGPPPLDVIAALLLQTPPSGSARATP